MAQFDAWLLYVVAAPTVIFFASWGGSAIAFHIKESFALAFGNGDVLPISAVILMGVAADVDHSVIFANLRPRQLSILKGVGIILALVCLVFFGIINTAAGEVVKDKNRSVSELVGIARFSLSMLVLSVSFAILLQTKLLYERINANINSVSEARSA